MKIIAIGAHYDDIELGCGGTLARYAAKGHQIKMVVVSDSTGISFKGETMRTKSEAETEGKNGAAALGVKDVLNLKFPNKDVPYDSSSVEAIEKVLVEFQPELIFTHWPFDTHQDHRNASLATISAARNFNNIFLYEPFPPSGRSYVAYRPNLYIDITESINVKVASLEAHKSQHSRYGSDWTEAIVGRARMRGFESNNKYAESFEILRYEIKINGL